VEGDSTVKVPAYAASGVPAASCDVMFIDGGHTKEVVLADLKNFRELLASRSRNMVFFDDSHDCDLVCMMNAMGGCLDREVKFFGSDVANVLREAEARGDIGGMRGVEYWCDSKCNPPMHPWAGEEGKGATSIGKWGFSIAEFLYGKEGEMGAAKIEARAIPAIPQ
jgi:hypothetical protein